MHHPITTRAGELGPVHATRLSPRFGRARETEKACGLTDDPKALEIVASLDHDVSKGASSAYRAIPIAARLHRGLATSGGRLRIAAMVAPPLPPWTLPALAASLCALLLGCATARPTVADDTADPGGAAACDPDRDRAAILSMAGTFEVDFAFEETRALVDGYALKEDYEAQATEVVLVLEDSPRKISLQHVLLIPRENEPSIPLKHWRQDWVFEDTELVEFQGRRVWQHRTLAESEARCAWSQAVHQVDDGPRYEGIGRFEHRPNGTSVWASDETWRPLPRREYTKRSDYDVLIAVNRHVMSDDGWSHEQENRKWVLDDELALVEERGLNTYRRVPLADADVAHEYMERTGPFWDDVRDEWAARLGANRRILVKADVDGTALHLKLFNRDQEMAAEKSRTRKKYIADTIGLYVVPLDEVASTR